MSRCPLSEPTVLSRLVKHNLTAEEWSMIRAHFQLTCEDCLAALGNVEAGSILLGLAGDQAQLSPRESDRMFEKIVAQLPRAQAPRRIWRSNRSWGVGLMAAAAAVALILIPLSRSHHAEWTGEKGAPTTTRIDVSLQAFIGSTSNSKRYVPGTKLLDGEFLLFRYRLSSPAYLYLFSPGESEPLWAPAHQSAASAAGEAEIDSDGRALGIPANRVVNIRQLILVASPTWIEPARARATALEGSTCVGCAVSRLTLSADQ